MHLEGSISPGVLLRIAKRNGRGGDVPDLEAAHALFRFQDPNGFFKQFLAISGFVQTSEDIKDIVADAGRSLLRQRCLYVEWTFAPQKFIRKGIPYPDLLDAIQEGLDTLDGQLEVRIIIDLVRNLGPEEAHRTMFLLREHPHPLVGGVGLGGTEDHGARQFAGVFQQARRLGLGVTAHAGESGGARSVRETLENLNLSRLDHGVRAMEDPGLVKMIADSGVILNLCPTSNFALGLYRHPSDYPLRRFLDAGIRITLGSDDPPFFDTSLTQELEYAILLLGMTPEEVVEAQRQALRAAFVSEEMRRSLMSRFEMLVPRAASQAPDGPSSSIQTKYKQV